MKKLATTGLLCMVVVFVGSTAFAQEFSASVGMKAWYNKWEGFLAWEDLDSEDYSLLVGPSVKLSYGRFFGGVNYLLSTSDYEESHSSTWDVSEFDSAEDPSGIEGSVWQEADAKADREDLDILAGVMIHPRVGVFFGYKRIISCDAGYVIETLAAGTDVDTGVEAEAELTDVRDIEVRISGFAFGVTCNYPLSRFPIVFTANAAYMPNMMYEDDWGTTETATVNGEITEVNEDSGTYTWHDDGYMVECGATYTLRENVAVSLGYKYQEIIKGNNVGEFYRGYGDMKFSGVSFGIDYRF